MKGGKLCFSVSGQNYLTLDKYNVDYALRRSLEAYNWVIGKEHSGQDNYFRLVETGGGHALRISMHADWHIRGWLKIYLTIWWPILSGTVWLSKFMGFTG